jgi:hypothetical protein
MAGWSSEVGEQLLARRLADQPVVMFRAAGGEEDKPTIEAAYRNVEGGEFCEQDAVPEEFGAR